MHLRLKAGFLGKKRLSSLPFPETRKVVGHQLQSCVLCFANLEKRLSSDMGEQKNVRVS